MDQERKITYEDISVTVFKEGGRALQVRIPVRVHVSHAQSEWVPFLNRVMRELELEDIEGVYEDVDGAPVVRIASLLNGGLYFARPTEACALLRSLTRTEPERYPAWPSIEEGLEAKRELERCQTYYKDHLLPMSLGGGEDTKAAVCGETASHQGKGVFLWKMRVKQGFKCRVYRTPECRPNEVNDTLPMGTTVTVSTDWGEAMEKHPLRGKGKGKVLWMIDPEEGFVERRPLEDVPDNGKAAATQVVPPTAFNAEERLEAIRGAASMPEILRAMLRRGAYFKGATSVHDCIDVHRAALRAAATLMRKDAGAREAMLENGGIELVALVITTFAEDRLLCEYGCWAVTVFAGEGDTVTNVFRFQAAAAAAAAGGRVLEAVACAVDAHRDSAPLRKHCVAALAAIVDANAVAAAEVHALNLHVTIAEYSIRRWPNDADLSCLSCWVLLPVVEPPNLRRPGMVSSLALGGSGSFASDEILMVVGGVGFQGDADSNGDAREEDRQGNDGTPSLTLQMSETVGSDGSGGAFGTARCAGVFGTGDDETSDLLIALLGDQNQVDNDVGRNVTTVSPGNIAAAELSLPSVNSPRVLDTPLTANATLSRRGRKIVTEKSGRSETAPDNPPEEESKGKWDGGSVPAGFAGEQDEAVLERLLKLAEATMVLNHDNEETRKAASALVQALLRQLEAGCADCTRRRKRASKGRVAQILRDGEALGAL